MANLIAGAILIERWSWRYAATIAACDAIAVAAFIPWLSIEAQIALHRTGYYWLNPISPMSAITGTLRAYGFADLFNISHPLGLAVVAVFAIGLGRSVVIAGPRRAIAVALVAYPIILFAISRTFLPIFVDQAMVPYTLPLVVLMYGVAIDWALATKPLGITLCTFLGIAAVISLHSVYDRQKEPWNLVAQWLDQHRTNEPILYWPAYAEWSVRFYDPNLAGSAIDLGDGRTEFRPFPTPVISVHDLPKSFWIVEDRKEKGDLSAIPNGEEHLIGNGLFVERFSAAGG
jgi:hypothetical protein